MSLVVHICINDSPAVELIVARRVTDAGETPDAVNLYAVHRFDTRDGTVRQLGNQQTVSHRYGDGAAVLARLALEAVTS